MTEIYKTPGRADRECEYWWFDAWDFLVNSAIRSAGSPDVKIASGEIALDPHIHTLFSHCSISQPEKVIRRAVALGLGAVAVTDHNDIRGALDAMKCAEYLKSKGLIPEDFVVIPGVEINSTVGHIGALFVEEDIPIPLTPEEAVKAIHDMGGLAIAVHPYHSTGIKDAIFDAPFDAVETECGSVFGEKLVEMNVGLTSNPKLAGMAKMGSSDGHYIHAIASCYTVVQAEPTLESIKQAIIDGKSYAKSSTPCMKMRKLLGGIKKLK